MWVVDTMAVKPRDRVLEIGFGRGVAAALVCQRLAAGSLLGLDRSAKAVAAAEKRNHDAVTQGRAAFRQVPIEDADPAELGRFDKVFAVNVNLFWTRPAQHELGVIADVLRPDGRLWLFYDTPAADGAAALTARLAERLERAGYSYQLTATPTEHPTWCALATRPEKR